MRAPVRRHQSATKTAAYDWDKGGFRGAVVQQQLNQEDQSTIRRFAASEEAAATAALVGVVSRALASDPVTRAYAIPGKEQRYCEAALQAGLLFSDSVGRDARLWLSECGRAAAVAYLCVGGGGGDAARPGRRRAPALPLWAGAQRAVLTATALTSLRPGEPARACARAATALARVRAAYCAAVERSVGGGSADEASEEEAGDQGGGGPRRALVAYVSVLAVDPPEQGKGLGTTLLRGVLRELLAEALTEDGGVAAAHAYVEASSERSAALYRRLGFREIARVGAGGDVLAGRATAAAAAARGGDEEKEEEAQGEAEVGGDEGGGGVGGLPDAPTFVMAAELGEGRFREWLVAAGR